MRYKTFSRPLRPVQISARQPLAPNVQFTFHSRGLRLLIGIENVYLAIADRTPDARLPLLASPDQRGRGVRRVLGRTVKVPYPPDPRETVDMLHQFRTQRPPPPVYNPAAPPQTLRPPP